jgi:hypothetical protein
MKWEEILAITGKIRLLGLQSEGKRQLARSNSRWESDVKMYLTEVLYGCVDFD